MGIAEVRVKMVLVVVLVVVLGEFSTGGGISAIVQKCSGAIVQEATALLSRQMCGCTTALVHLF